MPLHTTLYKARRHRRATLSHPVRHAQSASPNLGYSRGPFRPPFVWVGVTLGHFERLHVGDLTRSVGRQKARACRVCLSSGGSSRQTGSQRHGNGHTETRTGDLKRSHESEEVSLLPSETESIKTSLKLDQKPLCPIIPSEVPTSPWRPTKAGVFTISRGKPWPNNSRAIIVKVTKADKRLRRQALRPHRNAEISASTPT